MSDKHFLLICNVSDDYLERRGQFRAAHLALANEYAARGQIVLGGALTPADMTVILFKCKSPDTVEAFVAADPYAQNGLVKSYQIREWTTVVGKDALTRVPVTA